MDSSIGILMGTPVEFTRSIGYPMGYTVGTPHGLRYGFCERPMDTSIGIPMGSPVECTCFIGYLSHVIYHGPCRWLPNRK